MGTLRTSKKERKVNNMTPTQNYVVSQPNPDPLERIADALESISRSLESIDQTLEDATEILMDCRVQNPYGSAIAVTGTIQQI